MKTNPKVKRFVSSLSKLLGLPGNNQSLLRSIDNPEDAAKKTAHQLGSDTQPLKMGFKPKEA